MNFEPDDDLRLLIDSVHTFAHNELRRHAIAVELSLHEGSHPWAELNALKSRLEQLGIVGAELPEQKGGSGVSLEAALWITRTLASVDASTALRLCSHNLALGLLVDSDAEPVRQRWSSWQAGGGWITWARFGDSWIIGDDLAEVRVRVDDRAALRLEETAASAEPASVLGLRSAGLQKAGLESSGTVLSGRAPFDPVARAQLDAAAIACGIGDAALEAASAYARERQQFGQPIGAFQGVQWKLADGATHLDAAWLQTLFAAATQPLDGAAAARAYAFAVERVLSLASDALQIHGGYGYTHEYGVERMLRDVRALGALWGGAHEARRRIAAGLSERWSS